MSAFGAGSGRRRIKMALFERDGWRCAGCGYVTPPADRCLPQKKSQQMMTVDHIKPASRGGTNAWDNLRAMCWLCNHKRGDGRLRLPHPADVVHRDGTLLYFRNSRFNSSACTFRLSEVAHG